MILYQFLRWRLLRRNFTSGFRSGDAAIFWMSVSVGWQQTKFCSYTSIRSYFRFRKTNICHIGILLPFMISTIALQLPCQSAPVCEILSKLADKWRYVNFQDGGSLWGKAMKGSTLKIRRSKVKVTGGWS